MKNAPDIIVKNPAEDTPSIKLALDLETIRDGLKTLDEFNATKLLDLKSNLEYPLHSTARRL
ncbi:hypothetical protein Q9L58_010251 [Maublancomyces gigas]|uniref:Uncharacterized protein n=1 Tax=Discina gigas TaxID=1032678 RepID=A0ABR3G5M2_9PEZI